MVSSIQKSCKRKLSSFTMNTMVNFCKVCDVHMFFVEEIIEAVSCIAKRWPKMKKKLVTNDQTPIVQIALWSTWVDRVLCFKRSGTVTFSFFSTDLATLRQTKHLLEVLTNCCFSLF